MNKKYQYTITHHGVTVNVVEEHVFPHKAFQRCIELREAFEQVMIAQQMRDGSFELLEHL